MTQRAAATALAQANLTAQQIHLCELHDCFSANQLISLDALGLCAPGEAHLMIRNHETTYTGRCTTNPSGGLISKGHPLGATGLAQCAELTWQLRGWANNRLPLRPVGAALQHNLGLGGAVVVTVYKRADGADNAVVEDDVVARLTGLGYNPATCARGFTRAQAEGVSSRVAKCEFALAGVGEKVLGRF